MTLPALRDIAAKTPPHPAWLGSRLQAVTDSRLQSEILGDSGLVYRLLSDAFPVLDAADGPEAEEAAVLLDSVSPLIGMRGLRLVGLAWLAPRLSLCLMAQETRAACGELDAQELQIIRKFHDHIDLAKLPALPDVEDVPLCGAACFLAWTLPLSEGVSTRLRLLLPPLDIPDDDLNDARSDLFSRMIDTVSE